MRKTLNFIKSIYVWGIIFISPAVWAKSEGEPIYEKVDIALNTPGDLTTHTLSYLSVFLEALSAILGVGAVIAGGLVVVHAFMEANKTGVWGRFVMTFALMLLVVGVALSLSVTGYTSAGSIAGIKAGTSS